MIRALVNKVAGTGNILSLLSNLVFSVFGFGSFLLLVRLLNKETFGQWILFLTITSLLDMLRLGLNGTAAIRLLSSRTPFNDKEIIASSYHIGLLLTLVLGGALASLYFFTLYANPDSIYLPLFIYYPLLAVANLPLNQALVKAQGKVNFKRIFILRLFSGAASFLLVAGYILFINTDFRGIVLSYILAYAITSAFVVMLRWDGILQVRNSNRQVRKEILNFGKYSTASYIGSNLLRSSDTLILSFVPFMGPEAIAVYAVPLKFVEVVEIPLRSFTATAFPRLSQILQKGKNEFYSMLFSYTFWTTILLIPVIILLLLFPLFFLNLLGGEGFGSENLHIQRNILFVICIYIFILPLDRYSGVALFALNMPKHNFYKILSMLFANVVFDLIAIYLFKSLVFVAVASLIFTLIGIILGWAIFFRTDKKPILNNLNKAPRQVFSRQRGSLERI